MPYWFPHWKEKGDDEIGPEIRWKVCLESKVYFLFEISYDTLHILKIQLIIINNQLYEGVTD